MLVSRLLRSLLRFLSPGIVPDGGGGAPDPAPVVDSTPAPAPAPAEPSASADTFAPLRDMIATIGAGEGAPTGGQPRDPLGRFAPIDPNAAPAPAAVAPTPAPAPVAAKDPAQTPAPVPPAPKPGEVDLTPPEGMNERAAQRWQQLTERAKLVPDLERRATEASQALDSVRQLVSNSGLAPNEFSDMLETARLAKSTNPQEAQQALQRLDAIRSDLAQRFGLDAPGVDPLAAHPDLKNDVDGMLMTRERALEIARLRAGNQQHQQLTQEQAEQRNHAQAIQSAATSMDAALKSRAGTPGHDAKVGYIVGHFQNPANLQAFVKTYQPQQWQSVLMAMYDAFTPQAAPAPAAPPVPQPLRPSAMRPGAAVQSGPITADSAIRGAFASVFGG